MKMLLNIVPALGFVTNCALAADNLDCRGPFGEISDAPSFTIPAGHLGPGEAGMTCPPIPSNVTVSAVDCLVRIAVPPKPEATFRCPVDAPCPGVGTFQKIERVKGPMGLDQLCVTYVNQGANTETFGVRATLAR